MKRHAFDPTSFVFGLLFSVLALAALAGGVDIDALRLQWLFPLALIVTGVIVIGSSVTGARRSEPAPASDSPEPTTEAVEAGGGGPAKADGVPGAAADDLDDL